MKPEITRRRFRESVAAAGTAAVAAKAVGVSAQTQTSTTAAPKPQAPDGRLLRATEYALGPVPMKAEAPVPGVDQGAPLTTL